MAAPRPDIALLLERLQPQATLVERHVWLMDLLSWIRGDETSSAAAVTRVDILLDLIDTRPGLAGQVKDFWRALTQEVDGSALLADYGFASRAAFVSELVERLQRKVLPGSPETRDACELFALLVSDDADAQWLAALPDTTLERLAKALSIEAPTGAEPAHPHLTHWQSSLVDALTFCTSQIRAAGFTPDVRMRMSLPSGEASPFRALASDLDTLLQAWRLGADTSAALAQYRTRLEACRAAAATVYAHLDAHGISVDLVFRLRQIRERILRIRALLDCLLGDAPQRAAAKLFSHLASVGQEQRSVGALISNSSSLLAAKVAERNSETGEHYISRNRDEYRTMLAQAAGGGALTAVTTALKFVVMALGLTAFWYGFWSGVVYAVSFVVIQLLHFTLATKQPAMTAPAMAAKLKDVSTSQVLAGFVDEVTHLVRSQVAAILGNVVVVFPAAIALSLLVQLASGSPLISAAKADYVLHSLTLLGPSLLFAAFTGVLLFSSSILAGWFENWFVLHRLDSAIRYNPRIQRTLGAARADRWATFMRNNVSGFAANISLGFMLGMVPPVLAFVGLGLDVRHVTLSTGQLGAACASLGWDVVRSPALWWAVAALPFIGVLNVGVSFFFAFRVALRAHNVGDADRHRITSAIWARLRQAPLSFFWPARETGV